VPAARGGRHAVQRIAEKPAPPGPSGADERQDLVAARLHRASRRRFQVEPEQRLGIGRAHVEMPVRILDRDAIHP